MRLVRGLLLVFDVLFGMCDFSLVKWLRGRHNAERKTICDKNDYPVEINDNVAIGLANLFDKSNYMQGLKNLSDTIRKTKTPYKTDFMPPFTEISFNSNVTDSSVSCSVYLILNASPYFWFRQFNNYSALHSPWCIKQQPRLLVSDWRFYKKPVLLLFQIRSPHTIYSVTSPASTFISKTGRTTVTMGP